MKNYQLWTACSLFALLLSFSTLKAVEKPLPEAVLKVMNQDKYKHSIWGLYVKDLKTGEILYSLNYDKLFSPASTTKLFSVAALINAYGDDYRFKTPVYAVGKIENGQLQGNLILVAQGDLTMGGRQPNPNTIAYTKMDHTYANEIPGVILTKENPLHGLNELAKQIYQKGIKEINGNVLIDDNLFESTEKREMILTPIFINENLIDFVFNPSESGQTAKLTWRPHVPGYEVTNQVKTVAKGEPLAIEFSSDEPGHKILIKGTIPLEQTDVVRTFSIKDPSNFAREAFIQALREQGIKVNLPVEKSTRIPSLKSYEGLQPVALWTSPPLSEYAKLILKVSHNMGANLVPLLLAARRGEKTYEDGMRLLGDFVKNDVKLSADAFVFVDAAGGNDNRLTPQAEVTLLEYIHKQPPTQFQHFFDALPILGVDGNLEDFGKETDAVGKVRAKPGTGISYNLATGKLFLITQALGGYIEGKNGHLFAYMLAVNNGKMPAIKDVFPIFEDVSQISSVFYDQSDLKD